MDPTTDVLARRKPATWIAASLAALMLWSLLAARGSAGDETPIEEPSDVSAYSTFADAAPVQGYFDHQARLIPLGPAIAHSQSAVDQPSLASSMAWLADAGNANGLHGTTTGAKVPTQVAAQQPGGSPAEEFSMAGGPIGDDGLMRVRAGRALASAERGGLIRGYGNSYVSDLWVMPAAGSPKDPPGTFDPGATYPGGTPGETDPAPHGQMAILSIGSIASTSESVRNGSTLTSVGVAELQDINIGNRTSDNRCAHCIRIDYVRAEAFAESNGRPGGSRASYRVILGRACHRSFDSAAGIETDECAPLDPHDPEGKRGLQSVDEIEALNEQFSEPIWTQFTDGQVGYTIGIRIHAGSRHDDPDRAKRTSSPKDDPERNYAYPDSRPKDPKNPKKGVVAPDRDRGQTAKAVAEGLDVDIYTITTSQLVDDGARRIAGTPAQQLVDILDEDHDTPGIQINPGPPAGDQTGTVTVPIDNVTAVRRLQLALGVARASATARPMPAVKASSFGGAGGGGSSGGGPSEGAASGGMFSGGLTISSGIVPTQIGPQTGSTATTIIRTGLRGPLKIRVDWDTVRFKPWPPADMAKAFLVGGIVFGMGWLLRRRLRLGSGGAAPGS